ncbi:MAG: prephenate dehydrogenase, partial [bacterium]
GASLALALKERGIARRVVGVGRSEDKLKKARARGIVDSYSLEIAKGCSGADLIVLCTPISIILEQLDALRSVADKEAIVTDVGSAKATVVTKGEEVFASLRQFVGSHPMSGSEKTSSDFADPKLYEGNACYVTVTPQTDPARLRRVVGLWRGVGSRVIIVRPDRHDQLVAMLSHLPHLAAVALVRSICDLGEDAEFVRQLIGNGFRDTTRIAQGDSKVWRDILQANREAVLEALEKCSGEIEHLRALIRKKDYDALEQELNRCKVFRTYLDAVPRSDS